MEMLVIIANDNKVRKKVKSYLRDIGLGDFIVMQSVGSTAFDQYYTSYKPVFESAYKDISIVPNNSKTIFVVIKDIERSEEILDNIANLIHQDTKKQNTGIAFTIPFNGLFEENVGKKIQ